jgi:regulator of RNase E activity RraA
VTTGSVDAGVIEELATFSTPAVLNGLKRLGVDPGALQSFDRQVVSCISPIITSVVGFAITRKVATRRTGPPTDAARTAELTRQSDADGASLPRPRILVVQNIGDWRGPVCIWGDVAANINLAHGVRAGITNGPVRDVAEMEAAGFVAFAGGVGVGGGHVDLLEVSRPVALAGVVVEMGDLIHGDRHGAVKIPVELAAQLPDAIRRHERVERRVIEVCRSADFSADISAETLAETLAEALAQAWLDPDGR